jgi:cytochrome c-type biogenesis protein CcmF
VLAALVVPFLMGRWSWLTAFGLLLAAWVIATVVFGLWQRLKHDGGSGGLMQRLRRPSPSFYGMHAAHLGIAVFIIGVTLVNGYQSEADVKMAPGEHATLAGHEFRFTGTREIQGPNYAAARGTIEVSREGRRIATLQPEKRIYTAQNMPMTEAAIDRGLTRDLYVAMGEELSPPGTWIVRLWYKPFVNWIWIGCVIMALGGLLAASDRRYRVGKPQ